MACKFPGGADTPEAFWDLLKNKRSAWKDKCPPERFDFDSHWHPLAEMNGTFNVHGAHFVTEDVAAFDAPFFNISAAEAKAIDPQQRLTIESAFEAMESAGVTVDAIAGSRTAVFVNLYNLDYSYITTRDPEDISKYQTIFRSQGPINHTRYGLVGKHGCLASGLPEYQVRGEFHGHRRCGDSDPRPSPHGWNDPYEVRQCSKARQRT